MENQARTINPQSHGDHGDFAFCFCSSLRSETSALPAHGGKGQKRGGTLLQSSFKRVTPGPLDGWKTPGPPATLASEPRQNSRGTTWSTRAAPSFVTGEGGLVWGFLAAPRAACCALAAGLPEEGQQSCLPVTRSGKA